MARCTPALLAMFREADPNKLTDNELAELKLLGVEPVGPAGFEGEQLVKRGLPTWFRERIHPTE